MSGILFGGTIDDIKLKLSAKGWYQAGVIGHSSDTAAAVPESDHNYNNNFISSPGGQFTVLANIGDHWQGAMGFGGYEIQTPQGNIASEKKPQTYSEVGFRPYVTQAMLAYHYGDKETPLFKGTLGLFPVIYNSDSKNFGGYLLRGPVYPGLLFSGFESKDMDSTIANTLGVRLASNLGSFSFSYILKSETDLPPVFDFSMIGFVEYKYKNILTLGAGVNFYRIIAIKPELTDLTDPDLVETETQKVSHPYSRYYTYVEIDTVSNSYTLIGSDTVFTTVNGQARSTSNGKIVSIETDNDGVTDTVTLWASNDTTRLSHRGIKLMGKASLSLPELLGLSNVAPYNLKLYTEFAVIGWKNYAGIYENRSERIPIMAGITIPTGGILSQCNFEVEWYGAKFRNDYIKIQQFNSPIPVSNTDDGYDRTTNDSGQLVVKGTVIPTLKFKDYDVQNMVKDNWKWSLYMARDFEKYVRVSLQIANDHYRPWENYSPNYTSTTRYESAFTSLKDYYTMFKVGFTF